MSLMILCKTLLFITLGYIKKMYKSTLGKSGLLTVVALCTLSSNISAGRQKIEKNAQDVSSFSSWWTSKGQAKVTTQVKMVRQSHVQNQ